MLTLVTDKIVEYANRAPIPPLEMHHKTDHDLQEERLKLESSLAGFDVHAYAAKGWFVREPLWQEWQTRHHEALARAVNPWFKHHRNTGCMYLAVLKELDTDVAKICRELTRASTRQKAQDLTFEYQALLVSQSLIRISRSAAALTMRRKPSQLARTPTAMFGRMVRAEDPTFLRDQSPLTC